MVIYIDIPDEEIRRRSAIRSYCPKCNRTYSKVLDGEVSVCQDDQTPLQIREDDKPEVIENRIKVFHEEAEPTINFFKEKGLLHTIDGVGSVEEVFARIDNVIQELTKNIYDNN
jgi:adenylate kinase